MAKHSRVYSSDQYQHSKCPAVVSSIMHEVVAPHVISICRTQPYTRSVIEPQSSSFRLFLRHFQAVSSPKSFDTFVIHFPTSSSQSFGHPTIAVPTVLLCQPKHALIVRTPDPESRAASSCVLSAACEIAVTSCVTDNVSLCGLLRASFLNSLQ